jgi:tetratricopeptide (TPR) repeat protein
MPPRLVASKVILALSSVAVCVWPVWASRQTAADDYSKEPYVLERNFVKVVFDAEGTETRDVEVRVRVQSAAGLQEAGTLSLPYSREMTTLEVKYVRSRKPDGTIVETAPSSAIELPADVTRLAPTYSDLYVKQFNVRGLAVGDTLEYAFRTRERSLIPGQFWLEWQWPSAGIVLDEDFEVSVPTSAQAKVKTLGDPQAKVETTSGLQTYRWHYANLKRLSEKEVVLRNFARRNQSADVRISSFQSWADVGAAVRDLWRDRTQVTPQIRDKALELTRDLKSDDQKLSALYAFVSTKIRYVAISLGVGRIQPHAAAEVLENGFGDCKDKSTLLTALLAAVSINAEPALIAPGVWVDADVPSISQFNHVITTVTLNNAQTWMDTTLEVAPLGLLIGSERDANVLLVPASGAARLVKTPAAPSRPTSWHTDTVGTIGESGTLEATVHEVVSGDLEIVFRAAFRALPQTQWLAAVKGLPLPTRFGGSVSDLVVSSLEDTSTPLQFDYHYKVDAFSDWATHKVTAAVALINTPLTADDAPAVPLTLDGPLEYVFSSRLTMPDSVSATLNEDVKPDLVIDQDFARYRLHNALNGRVFETRRELLFKKKEIPPDVLPAYRTFVREFSSAEYSVRLRPTTWEWDAASTVDWYVGEGPETRKILQDAADAATQGDRQEVEKTLTEFTRTKPTSASGWMMLGWVQLKAGKREEGIATLRKGIATAPTPDGYKLLALWLPTAEALDVWRDGWQKFGKSDDEFALYLGEALVGAQKYSEAVTVLQTQAQRQTKSSRFQWDFGRALLNDNKRDAGVAALKSAAELDPRPLILNNVAWEFAIRSIALDDALLLATRAVKGIEEQASQLTLAKVDAAALGVMSSLGAYWDTLAWTHFKMGHLDEAERYQLAASDLMVEDSYVLHLSEIAAAKHNQALSSLYADIAAGMRGVSRPGGAIEFKALLEKNAQIPEVRALTAAWNLSVPSRSNTTGTAEAYVLSGPDGKITDVAFISGDDAMRPQVDAVRGLTLVERVPPGSVAKLLRRGILRCTDGAPACQFVLVPARTAAARQ